MGTIYFVKMETGPIKIGYTSRPIKVRLGEIQSDSPYELSVLAAYKGDKLDESWIHETLAEDKIRGEWFRPSVRVKTLMDRLERTGRRAEVAA